MGRWPAFLSHWASLPEVVVLPEPCRPAMRMTDGRLRGRLEAGGVFAEDVDELVVDDLDDLLGGRQRCCHLGAEGAGADVVDEGVDDGEVDVGLEEGEADLADGVGDVLFGDGALAAEILEGALEFVA